MDRSRAFDEIKAWFAGLGFDVSAIVWGSCLDGVLTAQVSVSTVQRGRMANLSGAYVGDYARHDTVLSYFGGWSFSSQNGRTALGHGWVRPYVRDRGRRADALEAARYRCPHLRPSWDAIDLALTLDGTLNPVDALRCGLHWDAGRVDLGDDRGDRGRLLLTSTSPDKRDERAQWKTNATLTFEQYERHHELLRQHMARRVDYFMSKGRSQYVGASDAAVSLNQGFRHAIELMRGGGPSDEVHK